MSDMPHQPSPGEPGTRRIGYARVSTTDQDLDPQFDVLTARGYNPIYSEHASGTRSAERMPHLELYWTEADPAYCDGEGAERFGALLRRAEAALPRLNALPAFGLAYVFSHGRVIQAVRAVVSEAELDDRGENAPLLAQGEPPVIGNAELVQFRLT